MKTYEFDVVLKGIPEVSEDQADALFIHGCDDGTPACRDGLAWVHFDREAPSLEEAIHSAISHQISARLFSKRGFTARDPKSTG